MKKNSLEGSNTFYYEPIINIIVTNENKADKIHEMYDKKKLINSQNVDKTLKLYIKKKNIIVWIKMVKFKSSEYRSITHEQ